MTPYFGLLLIILIAIIGTRFFGRSAVIKTPLFSGLIVSGIPYILIGVILGPQFFNFLNEKIILSLEPLISLALGWVGLLFGLQLRWRNIRRFPRNYLIFTSAQSLISFLVILMFMALAIYTMHPPNFENIWEAVIILAALGSITAPLSIARIAIEMKLRGRLTHLLQFISSLDAFWGIVIAGLTMALFHAPAQRLITSGWQWIIILIAASVLLGLLFRYLLNVRFLQDEIFILVLGMAIFTSGIGFYLHLSPILMTMIAGVTLAQFPRESEKVLRVIHNAEKPVYLLLLVFAGAYWNYRFWEEILIILAFIAARFLGKYVGGFISAKRVDCAFPIPADVGKALLSFGGISLAVAFNFQLFYGGFTSDFIMSATILGIFLFDEYTAVSLKNILYRQGEA